MSISLTACIQIIWRKWSRGNQNS